MEFLIGLVVGVIGTMAVLTWTASKFDEGCDDR